MDPPEYHKMSHIPFLEGEELERETSHDMWTDDSDDSTSAHTQFGAEGWGQSSRRMRFIATTKDRLSILSCRFVRDIAARGREECGSRMLGSAFRILTSSVCSKFVMYLAPAYSLMVSRAVASEEELTNLSTKCLVAKTIEDTAASRGCCMPRLLFWREIRIIVWRSDTSYSVSSSSSVARSLSS
eukprot:scaffold1148_cov209-Alexandrium_tamarense.AAC.9